MNVGHIELHTLYCSDKVINDMKTKLLSYVPGKKPCKKL